MTARRNAFTLIELLVVTAILGVLATAIGACLTAGIRVWDTAQTFATIEADTGPALSMMRRDLHNTYRRSGIRFEGERSRMSFPGLVGSGGGELNAAGAVTYRFSRMKNALVRETRPYPPSRIGGDRGETVVADVRDLRLSYFRLESEEHGPPSWQEYAGAVTTFPGRVDLEMTLATGGTTVKLQHTFLLTAVDE